MVCAIIIDYGAGLTIRVVWILFPAVKSQASTSVGCSTMALLSSLCSYGLRRCIDVTANILLRFGLRFLDRLMGDGFASVSGPESGVGSGVGPGVVAVPMEGVGGSVVGPEAVAEDQLPDCADCVVEFLDGSEVALVSP